MTAPRTSDLGLREWVALARRHWGIALLTFQVILLLAAASTLVVDPVHRASAEVLLRTEASQQLFPRTSAATAEGLTRSPASEVQYAESDDFGEQARAVPGGDVEVEVRREAGESSRSLSIGRDEGSSVLSFVAEASDAEDAAAGANAWAETYVRVRHGLDVRETQQLRDLLAGDRLALEEQRQALLRPVTALDAVIAGTTDPVELTRLLNQRLALQRSLAVDLDPLEAELRRIDTQVSALETDQRVLEDPEALAFVSQRAEPPGSPVSGSLRRNILVGILAGLVGAAVAVAVMRFFFHRVTTVEDLQGTSGLPVLAQVRRKGEEIPSDVEVTSDPTSDASEGYRSLFTAIDVRSPDSPVHRLVITGLGAGDGAVPVAANVAAIASQDGSRVLAVDMDLREAALHLPFGLGNDVGLTDVLGGRVAPADAIHVVELPGARVAVLPGGPPSADPAQLLRSAAGDELLRNVVAGFDLVVYVTGPLDHSEALVAARASDAVVLAVQAGAHPADRLQGAVSRLASAGASTIGAVLVETTRSVRTPTPRRRVPSPLGRVAAGDGDGAGGVGRDAAAREGSDAG